MARFVNEVLVSSGTTQSNWIDWPGGAGTLIAMGNWGASGLVKVQMRIEGETEMDLSTELQASANKAVGFQICPCQLRVVLTGSGATVRIRLAPSTSGWFPQADLPDTGSESPPTFAANHFINEVMDDDGNSTIIKWRGGPGTFAALGDWDGANVHLEFSFDGTSWADVPGMELTFDKNDVGGFHLGPCQLRAVMDDAGAETEVRVRVLPAYPGWLMDVAIPDTVED